MCSSRKPVESEFTEWMGRKRWPKPCIQTDARRVNYRTPPLAATTNLARIHWRDWLSCIVARESCEDVNWLHGWHSTNINITLWREHSCLRHSCSLQSAILLYCILDASVNLQQEAVNAFRMNVLLATETGSLRLRKSPSIEATGGLPNVQSLPKIIDMSAPHVQINKEHEIVLE
jgi:hypothetical protein